MVVSEIVGSRAQVDPVDLRSRPGGDYKYVLHHHSGFSHVAPLVDRESETVGLDTMESILLHLQHTYCILLFLFVQKKVCLYSCTRSNEHIGKEE